MTSKNPKVAAVEALDAEIAQLQRDDRGARKREGRR